MNKANRASLGGGGGGHRDDNDDPPRMMITTTIKPKIKKTERKRSEIIGCIRTTSKNKNESKTLWKTIQNRQILRKQIEKDTSNCHQPVSKKTT